MPRSQARPPVKPKELNNGFRSLQLLGLWLSTLSLSLDSLSQSLRSHADPLILSQSRSLAMHSKLISMQSLLCVLVPWLVLDILDIRPRRRERRSYSGRRRHMKR